MPVTEQHGAVVDGHWTRFRLWAPHAQEAVLVVPSGELRLEEEARGWFVHVGNDLGHGTDYAFRLDGGPERPDPASRWQPDGVHGRSRVLDDRELAWSDEETHWRGPTLAGAVLYELHLGTFTPEGTLDAAIPHLPDVAELGVTHVELMPCNAFNGEAGWGYDGVGWFAVHEPYGGPLALARFVDAAHRCGLAVVMDAVYNHLGPSGSYLPEFGPYLTSAHVTPWGEALNLDGPQSDPVRSFVIEAALSWLDRFHCDALRLDAVHGLVDQSSVHLLAELADAVAARATLLGRPLELIAESDRADPQTVRPRVVGGAGMDGQWVDDLHHGIHVAVTGEQEGYYADFQGLVDVAKAYRDGLVYDGRYSVYRERTVGAPLPPDVPGWRLVTCDQNHDQVGNRATGERLTTLTAPDLVRVAAVLLCASPTTPMLFMGEEWGETAPFQYFTSHPEPELAEAVRTGRAEEFAAFAAFSGAEVPDPQDPATVARSTLRRSRAGSDEGRARRALWTDLLALRRIHPALGNGRRDLVTIHLARADALALERADPLAEAVLLAVNLGPTTLEVGLPPGSWSALLDTGDERYGGDGALAAAGDGALRLPARQAVLLLSRP